MAKEGNYSRSWCRRGGHLEENMADSAQFLQLLTSSAEADSLPNISVSSCLFAGEKITAGLVGKSLLVWFFSLHICTSPIF